MAKLAYTLTEAAQEVPYSVDHLRRAVKRTNPNDNPLPARRRDNGRITILHTDLAKWIANEGDPL